jgi:hypothetical protein
MTGVRFLALAAVAVLVACLVNQAVHAAATQLQHAIN